MRSRKVDDVGTRRTRRWNRSGLSQVFPLEVFKTSITGTRHGLDRFVPVMFAVVFVAPCEQLLFDERGQTPKPGSLRLTLADRHRFVRQHEILFYLHAPKITFVRPFASAFQPPVCTNPAKRQTSPFARYRPRKVCYPSLTWQMWIGASGGIGILRATIERCTVRQPTAARPSSSV